MTIGQFRFTCLLIFMNILLPLYQAVPYVRWGKPQCQAISITTYDGYAAGNKWNSGGSGSNFLCMFKTPEWNTSLATTHSMARIWGVKYGLQHNNAPYPVSFNYKDMPCAVCENLKRNIIMIPGRRTCVEGWTPEYSGYIMSAAYSASPATRSEYQYICVDENIEEVPGSDVNDANMRQSVVYPTVAECGSLHCPPYAQHRQLTCVVCSK